MADASYTGGSTLDGGDFSSYSGGAYEDGGGFDWGEQTALERMRGFVTRYGDERINSLTIDYTDQVPSSAGLFPGGLVELSRTKDIMGHVSVESQYNFALYTVLEKSPEDDAGATDNAEWQMRFQEWVQEQSAMGLAPSFGDEPRKERMVAQNGELYSADEEGTALYVIQISVSFTKNY